MTGYFMEKYRSDEEYRKKHMEYMKQKVECNCGFFTSRSNMTRHLRSSNHQKKKEKRDQLANPKLLFEIENKTYDLGYYEDHDQKNWMWNYFALKFYKNPELHNYDVTEKEESKLFKRASTIEKQYSL